MKKLLTVCLCAVMLCGIFLFSGCAHGLDAPKHRLGGCQRVAERIQGMGRREGMLSKHLPLKIPQKHLFSAYVFRFAGPPASL